MLLETDEYVNRAVVDLMINKRLLVEVASRRTDDEVEDAVQIIRAVVRDADCAFPLSRRLDRHVGLQSAAELLLEPSDGRVA